MLNQPHMIRNAMTTEVFENLNWFQNFDINEEKVKSRALFTIRPMTLR